MSFYMRIKKRRVAPYNILLVYHCRASSRVPSSLAHSDLVYSFISPILGIISRSHILVFISLVNHCVVWRKDPLPSRLSVYSSLVVTILNIYLGHCYVSLYSILPSPALCVITSSHLAQLKPSSSCFLQDRCKLCMYFALVCDLYP